MGKIILNVPEELGPFLDEQAAHQGFKDRDTFVAELVAREADRARLRTLLEAGRNSPDMEGEVEAFFLRLRRMAVGSGA
ncbi:MAG TPA: hypothetical protein PLA85_12035 [Micropepsaceae bacterium]|nr:hypothetical protein [Micropepsaceae bacterium]